MSSVHIHFHRQQAWTQNLTTCILTDLLIWLLSLVMYSLTLHINLYICLLLVRWLLTSSFRFFFLFLLLVCVLLLPHHWTNPQALAIFLVLDAKFPGVWMKEESKCPTLRISPIHSECKISVHIDNSQSCYGVWIAIAQVVALAMRKCIIEETYL